MSEYKVGQILENPKENLVCQVIGFYPQSSLVLLKFNKRFSPDIPLHDGRPEWIPHLSDEHGMKFINRRDITESSFYLTSNNIKNIGLKPSDRLFSIPHKLPVKIKLPK
jgi:hypothetical protein